jgi:hypothetical protein
LIFTWTKLIDPHGTSTVVEYKFDIPTGGGIKSVEYTRNNYLNPPEDYAVGCGSEY